MKAVWKVKLKLVDGVQTVPCPTGPGLICMVAMQGDDLCLWLEGDTRWLLERRFLVRGTGHAIEAGDLWCGSCVAPPFVWHVYERFSAEERVVLRGGELEEEADEFFARGRRA